MVDTVRTVAVLQAIFADGQAVGSITPQDVRDMIVSLALQTADFSDLPTSASGLSTGRAWLDGTVVNIIP